MKSKQVLSIEQMRYLQELGLDTGDASMYWKRVSHGSRIDDKSKGKWFLSLQKEFQTCGFMSYETLPAYTLQDILDKLPPIIDEVYWLTLEVMDKQKNEWKIKYALINAEHECASFSSEKLIDVAYEMLCWCIEKGYIKTN